MGKKIDRSGASSSKIDRTKDSTINKASKKTAASGKGSISPKRQGRKGD